MSNTAPEKPDYRAEKKPQQPKHKVHDLRLHLQIAEHDLTTKVKQVQKFLEKRDQVRITLQLRGREKGRPQSGMEFMQELVDRLTDWGTPATPPRLNANGNNVNIAVTLNPKKIR